MADSKITALTALTAADPANDMIPIVDVSDTPPASGNTKRISINNILACSPTATLASATITGAATVGTTLGVTGVSTFAAGTALLPALTTTGDTNTGIYYPAADTFAVTTGGTERYRVDSSGNVGIGVTPSAWASSYKALQFGQSASVSGFSSELAVFGSNCYFDTTDSRWERITSGFTSQYYQTNGTHVWRIGGTAGANTDCSFTQAMTLDASGNLLVGTTTNAGVRLDVQTTTGNCIGRVKSNAAASTASFIIDYVETLGCTYIKKAGSDVWIYGVQNDTSATPAFKINTASNVGVQLVSGATAWTTLSDETVKDIIEPISNAVAKVGSIRSVIGKFKTDDSSKRRSFLIAQDVQSVLPEAVDVVGENNELGLRYTEVIPLLVAAIKELTAEVNALKNA